MFNRGPPPLSSDVTDESDLNLKHSNQHQAHIETRSTVEIQTIESNPQRGLSNGSKQSLLSLFLLMNGLEEILDPIDNKDVGMG